MKERNEEDICPTCAKVANCTAARGRYSACVDYCERIPSGGNGGKWIKKENEKLKKCVEFYADHNQYDIVSDEKSRIVLGDCEEIPELTAIPMMNHIKLFGGKRARQCLKEINN